MKKPKSPYASSVILQPGKVQPSAQADEEYEKLKPYLAKANCAFYASEYLQGPPEQPYNGKFMIVEHHEDWADIVNRHDRVCINAARDHGKCMTGDALILTPSGARVRHDEWVGGEVYAWDGSKFVVRPASAAEPQGLRECLHIRTRTGREMTVTLNHPLLRSSGWTPAEALCVGDAIASVRSLPVFGRVQVESPWLLGLIVGDGTLNNGCSVTVTTGDALIVAAGEQEAAKRGWRFVPRDDQTFALSTTQGRRSGTAKHWIRELGLMNCTAKDKHVPSAVFESSPEVIAEFLSGYLDADGNINQHAGGAVEFYSVSEPLLRGVQHLLTRFGVVSTLAPKKGQYKGEVHWSWRLTIRGEDVLRLSAFIHLRGARKTQLAELVRWLEPRAQARRNDETFWDEVVEIASAGLQETYGICIPGLSNYVANDVVQHNTFFFNFAYPIWQAERHPNKKGFIFSGSQPQASAILLAIQREIETNPVLTHLLPAKGERKIWGKEGMRLANGHEIHARGYGSKVRGAHPVWIVCDDVLNDEDATSETVRLRNIEYFYNAISNMIIPTGQIVVIGTPYHQRDLYADLSKNNEYFFKAFPAMSGDPGREKALWPERYPLEKLQKKQKEIGSIRFTREFLCKAVSDDSSLFPSTLFNQDGVMQLNARLGAPRRFWNSVGVKTVFMGVDFALSSNVGSDYTVVWVMGIDDSGNRWIIDILREHGLSFGAQKALINDAARKYQPALIFCESNQAQRIFGESLIQETDLPVKLYQTGDAKHSLEKGVPALRLLLENKKVRIPRGDERSIELTDVWMDEMRNHTFTNGRVFSTGEHDDTVMAFWICNNAVAAGNFGFSFGEEEGDLEAYEQVMKETMNPERPEEELEEDDFVLGAQVQGRGRPRRVNAGLVDDPAELLALEEQAKAESKPELKPYREVMPQLGAPKASDFSRGR